MNIQRLEQILDSCQLIKGIRRMPVWNDDPLISRFVCELATDKYKGDGQPPDLHSGGASVDSRVALFKAVCEGLERFSLAHYSVKNHVFTSYKKINKNKKAIRPIDFCFFSSQQLKETSFVNFAYGDEEEFFWVQMNELSSNEEVFVPAQLVYCPYKYVTEKTILLPISTGAALAEDIDTALYKALCELFERDAFSTTYLLSLEPKRIVYKKLTTRLTKYLSTFEKFNLKVELYYFETVISIPTVVAIIIGDHPTTPAVAIGLKTDFDIENAIIGALDEAYQVRSWLRFCLVSQNFRGESYTEKANLKKGLFWSNPRNSFLLDFMRKTKLEYELQQQTIMAIKKLTMREKLLKLKDLIQKKKLRICYKDITHPDIQKFGLHVMKCVSPDLHPHSVDESYPYFGGNRLETLKKFTKHDINLIPNPFL